MGHSKFSFCHFFYSGSVLGVTLALITGPTSIVIRILILYTTQGSVRGSVAWTTFLCTCSCVLGRCWPNECPKQDCIVVPPPSNIMEVKK